MNYQYVKVNEVCKFVKGKKPRILGSKSNQCKVPYINIKAFETGVIDEFAHEGKYVECSLNDVLMVWDGSRSGYVGLGRPGYLGSTLAKVVSDKFNSKFLYYFFLYLYPEINSRAKGVGIPHVDPQILGNKDIPVLSLSHQKKLVEKIDRLFFEIDEGGKDLNSLKQKLWLYLQSVLRSALSGSVCEQNIMEEASLNLLQKIVEDKNNKIINGKRRHVSSIETALINQASFEIPSTWVWCKLGSLLELVTSGSRGWAKFYSDKGAIFIRSQNINKDRLILDDVAYVELPKNAEGARTRVQQNDLLVIITGANIAKCAHVKETIPEAYINQHVALLRPSQYVSADYLHMYLTSEAVGKKYLLEKTYGAGKPSLNLDNIKDLPVPLPPFKEQLRIVKKTKKIVEEINQSLAFVDDKINNSLSLKRSILKNAFEGKLL